MKAASVPLAHVEAVAIGTSAGGVDALGTVLPALPVTLKVPVFLVIHLPRDRPSLLVSIFEPKCKVPIREAEDKDPVERGTIYVAPPDYHLMLDKGPQLVLSTDEPVNYSRPSIDVLFESAAELYGRSLLAVLLTGANEDGAQGMRAVREAGGTTVVQSPEEAFAPLMPGAALERGVVDHVMRLNDIARLLAGLGARR
ncbi:MAG TPA: chemotaxis protein CheB [Nevskiaceae bacterium]|nr:chemotaxis protein CheB [Nevskiaceae bacterium]